MVSSCRAELTFPKGFYHTRFNRRIGIQIFHTSTPSSWSKIRYDLYHARKKCKIWTRNLQEDICCCCFFFFFVFVFVFFFWVIDMMWENWCALFRFTIYIEFQKCFMRLKRKRKKISSTLLYANFIKLPFIYFKQQASSGLMLLLFRHLKAGILYSFRKCFVYFVAFTKL